MVYGEGLFVRKDKDGKDISVGDIVQIKRESFPIEYKEIPELNITGKIMISKSRGCYIDLGKGKAYHNLKFTDRGKSNQVRTLVSPGK